MKLGALYHWSPADNRESILRDGLKPYERPCVHSGSHSFPYVCCGPDPRTAWLISGDMEWVSEIEAWDLWLVDLGERDEVHIRAEFGPRVYEVRIRTAIPADRVWWVGTREPLCARELAP